MENINIQETEDYPFKVVYDYLASFYMGVKKETEEHVFGPLIAKVKILDGEVLGVLPYPEEECKKFFSCSEGIKALHDSIKESADLLPEGVCIAVCTECTVGKATVTDGEDPYSKKITEYVKGVAIALYRGKSTAMGVLPVVGKDVTYGPMDLHGPLDSVHVKHVQKSNRGYGNVIGRLVGCLTKMRTAISRKSGD